MSQRSIAQDPEQGSRRCIVDLFLPERRSFPHSAHAILAMAGSAFTGKQFRPCATRPFLALQGIAQPCGLGRRLLYQSFPFGYCDRQQQASGRNKSGHLHRIPPAPRNKRLAARPNWSIS